MNFEDLLRFARQNVASPYDNQDQQYSSAINQTYRDLLDALQQLGAAQAVGVAVDPGQRLVEIDRELDIVRGVVATPKGYKVDPRKAKALMAERARLQRG